MAIFWSSLFFYFWFYSFRFFNGDTFTNLDLYVYDANGYLIDTKLGHSDYEVSNITVFGDTTLTVKVINRGGDFNLFMI